jgi:hypothetical protein
LMLTAEAPRRQLHQGEQKDTKGQVYHRTIESDTRKWPERGLQQPGLQALMLPTAYWSLTELLSDLLSCAWLAPGPIPRSKPDLRSASGCRTRANLRWAFWLQPKGVKSVESCPVLAGANRKVLSGAFNLLAGRREWLQIPPVW